jgi:hypothetical protein
MFKLFSKRAQKKVDKNCLQFILRNYCTKSATYIHISCQTRCIIHRKGS